MRTLLHASLLALPLSLACSADWKNQGDDPNGQDGTTGDGGATTDGGADGGTDGGTDGGADGGGTDGGGTDGGADGSGTDDDGDGWTEDEGDCDDGDGGVFPGAEEICNDGVDDDCDGVSDADWDTDGDGVGDCVDFCPVQVDVDALPGGDGSFAWPVDSVQTGIEVAGAVGCPQVQVHPGVYYETVDYGGVDADVYSSGGREVTTIDGDGSGPVVTFASGEGAGAKLRGFTVTGGVASRGAGIYVNGADPTLDDLFVHGNAATAGDNLGGGVYLYDSAGSLTNSVIQDNDAGVGGDDDGNDGGGLAILYGSPLVQFNQFLDNTAGDGGGIWVAHGSATIVNNLLDGNRAQDTGRTDDAGYLVGGQGGGVDFQTDTASVLFANNLVTNNTASTHGGGVAIIGFYAEDDVAEPTVAHNVVAWNAVDSGSYGGGLVVWGWSAPTLYNNVVWANDGVGVYMQFDYSDWSYNDVVSNGTDYAGAMADPTGTDGNLELTPGFASTSDDGDGTNDVFRLRSTSGLVDVGDPAVLDVDGSRSDVGAYGGEYGGW